MAEASDLTPAEWVARLGKKIRERQPTIERWQRYYEGYQDLPSGPQQHKDAYRRFQKLARTNLCGLCVDSRVHRMKVTGFRNGTGRTAGQNSAVWDLWQREKMDSRQFTVYRKAFSQSEAFVIVSPSPADPRRPRLTIESPLNVTVEVDPGEPSRRIAALRMWHDPLAKRWMATLWLRATPGQPVGRRLYYESVREMKYDSPPDFAPESWRTRADEEPTTADVPVYPFLNGDEGEDPRSAFDVGLDVQNRLNLTLLNRLTAERYAAFRQRYLTNYTPVEDPETGLLVPPFNPGADQTITIPPPEPGEPEPRIGDLAQTDTSQMLRACESDIRSFAAVTITPVYYLPGGDLTNIGSDTIVALDAGHVQSIKERMAAWSEVWEEVLQTCSDIAELGEDLSSSEIVWDPPEAFNPAAVADYATKLRGAGVPLPMIAEEIGWSPQQVDRLRNEMTQEQMRAALAQPAVPRPGGQSSSSRAPTATTPAAPAQPTRPATTPPVPPT